MKLLLLSILLVTPQLISSRIIIDLENKGREGSEYIKNLQWITDKEIGQSTHKPGQNIMSEIKNQIRFNSPNYEKIAYDITTDIPSMKLTTIDEKGEQDMNYSLSQNPSDECFMLNYPETKIDSSVSCTYSNGYSVMTKSFPNKHYKKEISIGRYVIALTQDGKFDIGLIQDGEVYFNNSVQSELYKEGFKQFENITIKDFFIIPTINVQSTGNLWIVTKDKLILIEYQSAAFKIEFEDKATFPVGDDGLNLTELKQIFSYYSKVHYLIRSVGFYKLTKGTDIWEITFVEKINIKGEEIQLKNYEANLFIHSELCVAIKGYGLVIFDYDDMLTIKFSNTSTFRG
jgi:hypothetical protein